MDEIQELFVGGLRQACSVVGERILRKDHPRRGEKRERKERGRKERKGEKNVV